MAAGEEICEYCRRNIGRQEQAHVLNGRVACDQCDRELRPGKCSINGQVGSREPAPPAVDHQNRPGTGATSLRTVSETHLPTIARMHSTILIFSAGLFVAYSMQAYSTLESIKRTIFREAKMIYQVGVPFQCSLPGFYATLYGSEDVNGVNVAAGLASHPPNRPDAVWEDRLIEFQNTATNTATHGSPESRGQKMCDILIELLNHYPFPEFRGSGRINLRFETVAEIDAWQHDITVLRNAVLNTAATIHSAEVNAAVDAYSSKWIDDEVKRLTNAGVNVNRNTSVDLRVDNPKMVFERLCGVLLRTEDIVSPVSDHLDQLRIAENRYPGRTWFLGIAILCFIFFVIAIVIPIYICVYRTYVQKRVYGCVSLWLPLLFYVGLFAFLFYRLLR